MDGNVIAMFAIAVGFVITITVILADTISKYKLKVEQIKADALVRAEEVRAKNQLELEKLLNREQKTGNPGSVESDADYYENISTNTTA